MATFVPNPAAIAAFMTDPAGPVQRDMLRRGEAVLALARSLLAQSNYTEALDASLRVAPVPGGGVAIGSDLRTSDGRENACVVLHNGTGPAHITGDGGMGSLPDPRASYFPPYSKPEFAAWAADHGWRSSRDLARFIYAHGTNAIPFLREALVAARA
jgi:hypothetical protein